MQQQAQDAELVRLALQGRQEAYALLVERHQNFVFTLALKYVGKREEAEELAQDAFVKAYRSLADFRGDSRFSTWLYTIVHHTCLSHLRRRQQPVVALEPERMAELGERTGGGTGAGERIDAATRKKWVEKALALLPEDDARVITLFYQGEQSVEEIARITGMTPGNVKVRLFRARQKLRDILQQQMALDAGDLYLN